MDKVVCKLMDRLAVLAERFRVVQPEQIAQTAADAQGGSSAVEAIGK